MMRVRLFLTLLIACSGCLAIASSTRAGEAPPDYTTVIRPILTKYCVGCHNDDDVEGEGELSLESYSAIQKGGEHGPAMLPGNADASRMIRVLTGKLEPAMPPKDEPQLKPAQIELLAAWITGGAKGPQGKNPDRKQLLVPKLPPSKAKPPVTAVAISHDGAYLAVAKFQTVELRAAKTNKLLHQLTGHPGKINDARFAEDGKQLVVASGIAGLYGEARVWDVASGKLVRKFTGHRDTMYVAAVSRDSKTMATSSYDRKIILWDFATGKQLHVLKGHNGAVFDLAFSPDGKNLASASADATVKLWHVATGQRLDTRSEPLKEMYTVAFSPDGRRFAAAGADNRIRSWRFVSRDRQKINPLVHARYAHEAAVTRLRYTADGRRLVSAALDHSVKVWDALSLTQLAVFEKQSDAIEALAVDSTSSRIAVGRMDGSLDFLKLPANTAKLAGAEQSQIAEIIVDAGTAKPHSSAEAEPNNTPQQATALKLPAAATGVIHSKVATSPDVDVFRFRAKAGHVWIIEVNAARGGSPLDSKIEIIDADGKPVPRVLLQAVRDSYFTFRGKNSDQAGDFRLHNSQEMSLNQYLYANGEVVRLYHYPRGPDSGFNVYPNVGKRHGFFGTTPLSHALGEVCYIVEPRAPGSTIVPNGLPVFPINYENDDDSRRKLGKDSRLRFVAPRDGDYFVRVRDVRGYQGDKYKYTLSVRRPRPDFSVKINGLKPTVPAGAGRKFDIQLSRMDDFDGPVEINVSGLPPGFRVAGPLVVEAGHFRAFGTIVADANAPKPNAKNRKTSQIIATATVLGKRVTRKVGSLGEIKLGSKPKLLVTIELADRLPESGGLPVLEIPAGKTVRCKLRVQRNGHNGIISFGKEEAALNLPHGVYVDNTGLNGVLLLAGQNDRTVFITAEPWVKPMQRPIFFQAGAAEKPTSAPVIIRVVGGDERVAGDK